MRLVMCRSYDGFFAKHEADDMSWTGHVDKQLFRLVTLTGSRVLCAGQRTADLLAVNPLKGRIIFPLSREKDACRKLPFIQGSLNATFDLIGGPTVAEEAIQLGLIDAAIITVAPVHLGEGMRIPSLDAWCEDRVKFTITLPGWNGCVEIYPKKWDT